MMQSDSTGVPQSRNAGSMARDLVHEHGVLLRQIGGLQRRCTELLQTSNSRVAVLEADQLCLRAELVLLRTSVFWGLGASAVVRRARSQNVTPRHRVAAGTREAQAVICQTGCVGHAYPWLEADGQCRRSGQACDGGSEDRTTLER